MTKKILMVLLVALFAVSCVTVKPVGGASGVVGSKTGEASQAFWTIFPIDGEGGVAQAAKNGGIRRVGTIDVKIEYPASPAIPYYIVTTVVTGE